MDRRNVGDTLAPPRPPKTSPRIHRPRAPEPHITDNLPSIHIISIHAKRFPYHNKSENKMSINLKNPNDTNNFTNSSNTNSFQSIPPPSTAPLTPLPRERITNSNTTTEINTFSRLPMELPELLPIPPNRTLTPTSLLSASIRSDSSNIITGRNNSSDGNSVTLQIPRPEKERISNEYVDTPLLSLNNIKSGTLGGRDCFASSSLQSRNLSNLTSNLSRVDGNSTKFILNNQSETLQRPDLLPITKQPSLRNKNAMNKDNGSQFIHFPDNRILNPKNVTSNSMTGNSANNQLNSITCPQCNRCRCEECQRPRQLPSKWICDDNCYCSAETMIDYASCLCCVKALFYHCSKDHELDCENETIRCAEDPCSCVPYKRVSRWGCLSVLSLFLPCLCLFLPMRGCVYLCAKCYAKFSKHGCRCENNEKLSSDCNSFNNRQNIKNLTTSSSNDQQIGLLKPRCDSRSDESVPNRWKLYGLSDADLYL